MKPLLIGAMVAGLTLPMAAPVHANTIQTACLSSERAQGNQALCSCIQYVADQTLTRRDQRAGAKLFANPQAAQDIRQSSRSSDESFWERWRNFGEAATAICS